MLEYKTITEKAAEWGISSHHIQYLCRNGKIEGAIKRAGIWFVPDKTPTPAKNTKSDSVGFNFVGTKKRIFDTAINLFLLGGFDSVSLRDIANSAGIRQSTVYNHFKSKQEILDTIYDFYCHYYLNNRLSLADIEPKLLNESIANIIGYVRYEFNEDFNPKMSDITMIIFQRVSIDSRAREIAKELFLNEGIRYVEDVFNRLIALGRIASCDTHNISVFINSIAAFTLFHWIIDPTPDSMMKLKEDEVKIYNYAARYLSGLELPAIKE